VKRIAIVQSNYIPWKGYFDLIGHVDEFVLYDDAQFTRRDWRNRNRIKTTNGTHWLTIPVLVKGRYLQRIDETLVADPAWARAHWKTLTQAYAAAPHFDAYRDLFASTYESCARETRLSKINRLLLDAVCSVLGIETEFRWSTEYAAQGVKTERLLDICLAARADEYLSGPAAKAYLDQQAFEAAGIRVTWADYSGYREYRQLHPPFEHHVSVLDLIFNTGPDAPAYLKGAGVAA
jgi:WbqC-like protein family